MFKVPFSSGGTRLRRALVAILVLIVAASLPVASGATDIPGSAPEGASPHRSGISSLADSQKYASETTVTSDQIFVYTIELVNDGDEDVVVDVWDPLPSLVEYVDDSASDGGVYDDGTVSWDEVPVPAYETVSLIFEAQALPVGAATVVRNVATVSGDGPDMSLRSDVTIVPEGTPADDGALGNSRLEASKRVVAADDEMSYYIHVINSSSEAALVDVFDPLPDLMSYVEDSASHDGEYDWDNSTLSWVDLWVPADDEVTLAFDVRAGNVNATVNVTNEITIVHYDQEYQRSVTVAIVNDAPPASPADFAVRKWASASEVQSEEEFSYTIEISNDGDEETWVNVTDQLPEEVSFVYGSASDDGDYDEDAHQVQWWDVYVPADDSVRLTFDVTAAEVDESTTAYNEVAVTDGDVERYADASVEILPVSSQSDFSVRKWASADQVETGEEFSYTIEVTNNGDNDTWVNVTDQLPDEVSYVDGSASDDGEYDEDAHQVQWWEVYVPAGDSVQLTFDVAAGEVDEPTTAYNEVAVTDGDVERYAHASVEIVCPSAESGFVVSKWASAYQVETGEEFSYTIEVTNNGDNDTTVDVIDELPAEVIYVDGSASDDGEYDEDAHLVQWWEVYVPAGDSVQLTFDVAAGEVDEPTTAYNEVAVTDGDVERYAHASVEIVCPSAESGFVVSKWASASEVQSGEEFSFTIAIRNDSDEDATFDVIDPLPGEVYYVDDSVSHDGYYDEYTREVAWWDVYVPAGRSIRLTFDVTAADVDEPTWADNQATVSCTENDLELTAYASVKVLPSSQADLSVRKWASSSTVQPGQEFRYTIQVTNDGDEDAWVNVVDPLPDEVSYVYGSASDDGDYDGDTHEVQWWEVYVPAGDSVELTFDVTAEEVDEPTTVYNRVTVSCDQVELHAQASVEIVCSSSYQIFLPIIKKNRR